MIDEQALAIKRQESLFDILKAQNARASSALSAYARFLNHEPLRYEYFPLYMKIFEANNQYAVDALVEGFEPENFLNLVVVPNQFVMRRIFELLDFHKSNTLYSVTVRVVSAFIKRVYYIVEDGYRNFELSVGDVNNLGKHLNEEKDQDDSANRLILDILQLLSDLDRLNETDKDKLDVGRQSNRIRGDFLDNNRKLVQAITDAVLKKAETADFGIEPEY
jgi:hypothetical protein